MVSEACFSNSDLTVLSTFPKKLGILGGTFDPCHMGHIGMCVSVRNEFSLDRVLLLVAGDPPHKSGLAPAEHRLAMCELAAADYPFIEVSRAELRPGVTYTVDTLSAFSQVYDGELYYIIGSDTLFELVNWRDCKRVFELTRFICVIREGSDPELIKSGAETLASRYGARIEMSRCRPPGISSTEIRTYASYGMDVSMYTGTDVAGYIAANGIYK